MSEAAEEKSGGVERQCGWFVLSLLLLALAAPLALADAAEATSQPAERSRFGTQDQEALLKARAADYWSARVAREQRVMDFYAPPEKGGPKGLREVSEFGNVTYAEADVIDVKVGSNWGMVKLRVRVRLMVGNVRLPDDIEYAEFTERWNYIDGEWYKQPIPPGLVPVRAQTDLRERKKEYLSRVKELREGNVKESGQSVEPEVPAEEAPAAE